MNRFSVTNLLFCCLCATGMGQQGENSNPQFDEIRPPAHFKDIDWNKELDASTATNSQSRLRMLQYNALIPWHKELTEFAERELLDSLRIHKFQTKMARLRTQISNELNEKKKGLETEIYLLKMAEELYGLQMNQPSHPSVQSGLSIDVERLSSVIMQRVEREEELAQLNLQLNQSKK